MLQLEPCDKVAFVPQANGQIVVSKATLGHVNPGSGQQRLPPQPQGQM